MSADPLETLRSALSDRYRVERLLGSGGMATVYLAHDLKHDRPVAIKVLRPELSAALGPERFLREIRIAARLNHPHILALHDSGEAGGLLYYVMPYVEGESLQDRIAREKQLKAGSRRRKESLIEGMNPQWRNLAPKRFRGDAAGLPRRRLRRLLAMTRRGWPLRATPSRQKA